MIDVGLVAARFVHYAALVLAFGAFAYASFGDRAGAAVSPRLRRLAIVSSLAVLVGSLAVLVATAAGLAGGYGALGDAGLWSTVLFDTDFGQVWSARLLLASTLVAVALVSARAGVFRTAGVFAAGALLVSVALTGHAQVEAGAAGVVHRIADAVHLAAAGIWLGALVPFLFLLSARSSQESSSAAAERLVAFHHVGLVAVLLLVSTGVVNSWFLVGAPARLFDTAYGQLLLVKLALFAGMLGLAAGNRLRYVPALSRQLDGREDAMASLKRLRLQVRGEFLLGMLALLAVAVLGSMEPATESGA